MGFVQGLFRRLEAVGRLAFTNQIMHSVTCALFFLRSGPQLLWRIWFYQVYYLVIAVWIVQLAIGPIWLRHFYFGPVQMGWRSLT